MPSAGKNGHDAAGAARQLPIPRSSGGPAWPWQTKALWPMQGSQLKTQVRVQSTSNFSLCSQLPLVSLTSALRAAVLSAGQPVCGAAQAPLRAPGKAHGAMRAPAYAGRSRSGPRQGRFISPPITCPRSLIGHYGALRRCSHGMLAVIAMQANHVSVLPNNSFKLSPNGMSRWPSSAGPAAHFALAVQHATPSVPAYSPVRNIGDKK